MKIIYNDTNDLLYIRFDDTKQSCQNLRINDDIVLDIGEKDAIIGIEIMDASHRIPIDKLMPIEYQWVDKIS